MVAKDMKSLTHLLNYHRLTPLNGKKTNLASNVEQSTFPYLFVTPYIKQRELYVLNHFAYVVLKPHYFSICCRGAASTAFRCVGLKKPRRAKKCETFLIKPSSLYHD